MGNTTSDQRAPYMERFSLALLLPRFLLIGHATLIGGFGMAIMGVLWLMHHVSAPNNPFDAYADIMPGQLSSAVDAHGFYCGPRDYSYYHDLSETQCILRSESGAFSRIEVAYSDGLIHLVNFEIRNSSLTVGELAVMLELSEIRPRGRVMVFFRWRGHTGVTYITHPTNRFSMLRPVWRVALTDASPSVP